MFRILRGLGCLGFSRDLVLGFGCLGFRSLGFGGFRCLVCLGFGVFRCLGVSECLGFWVFRDFGCLGFRGLGCLGFTVGFGLSDSEFGAYGEIYKVKGIGSWNWFLGGFQEAFSSK